MKIYHRQKYSNLNEREVNPVRCSNTFLMEFLQLLSPHPSVAVTVTNLGNDVNIV
jgi:hypothetical protein